MMTGAFSWCLFATAAFGAEAAGGVDRGRYLVENVAMCGDCHTPPDESGKPDRRRWLHGGPHQYRAVRENGEWAIEAPRLAGLPGGYTREKLVAFLTTGVTATGRAPRPPMKAFRLKRDDAAAIAAYLESLGPPEK